MDAAKHILLVEDSRTQAVAMINILRSEGWAVSHAVSAEDALTQLSRQHFDLILIDFYLPTTRGDELCRQIRMRIDTRTVPVAILTSDAVQEVELSGLDSGADDFIDKSVDQSVLLIRLHALLAKSAKANPAPPPPASASVPLGARLLAIDDSRTYLAYLMNNLGEAYRVETTTNGADALDRIRNEDFDCVLVDLVMPDMDGIEVCQRINEARRELGKSIMLLMLTSKDDTESLASALEAGADDFVGKSSDIIVVKGRIRALLRRKMLEEENRQRLSAELRAKQLEAEQERLQREAAEAAAALINDLRQTAEALRCSEEELQQFTLAVRGSSDGLWSWNLENDAVWFSPTFKELLGYSDHEFPNRIETWLAHLHPEDRSLDFTEVGRGLESNQPYDATCRLKTKRGEFRWFRVRGKAFNDDNGKRHYFAGSLQDVTDLITAERKLEETAAELVRSNRDLEEFAYISSHDLRAPLRAIKNLVRWLEEDLADHLDAENRERMDLLIGRTERMDRLIEDLLEYSRAGRVLGSVQEVDLNGLVDEIAQLLDLPEGFQVVHNSDLPTFKTNSVPMETVLRNLIGNAVKHRDKPDSRVEVTSRDAGDRYEISVHDNGPGIPPEFHERIFGLFETLQPRDSVEGSGMGLAVVKRTVEKLGGRIALESQPGEGTTFRFTWPKDISASQPEENDRDSTRSAAAPAPVGV